MTILAATDFSVAGDEAVRVAAAFARSLRESLHIVHVIEPRLQIPMEGRVRLADLPGASESAARTLLGELRDELASEALQVTVEVRHGPVEDTLLAAVNVLRPRLCVVGGFGETKTSYHGIAESLAVLLPCPLLVTRPSTQGLRLALTGQRRLRVFAAIDRTLASDAPLAYLKWLRERIPCDVTVEFLYWPSAEHERLGVQAGEDLMTPDSRVTQALEGELRDRLGELSGEGSLTVRCHPSIGSVSVLAKRAAHDFGADMVIVGSHRRGAWGRLIHGSVSQEMMRYSDIPVLCVGHDVLGRRDVEARTRKVLVATDLTPVTNTVVAHAIDLLGGRVGSLNLVFVDDRIMDGPLKRPPGEQRRLDSVQIADLHARMRAFVPEALDDERVQVHTTVIEGGPAADAILQAAARWNADAICMSSRGVSAVERVLSGSVAGEVVQKAACPVLVVRTRQE